jgi:hypothetical protein
MVQIVLELLAWEDSWCLVPRNQSEWNNLWTTDGEYIYESANTSNVYLQGVRIFYCTNCNNTLAFTEKGGNNKIIWRPLQIGRLKWNEMSKYLDLLAWYVYT